MPGTISVVPGGLRPPGSPRARLRARRAFTLVELMAVMVIVAIMMVSIIPALDSLLPSYRLRSAARNIAGNIELAQSEAIGQRREFVIEYNLDNQTYRLLIPPQEVYEQSAENADGENGQAADPNAPDPNADPNDPNAKAKANRPTNDVEHGAPPVDPNAPVPEGQEPPDADETPNYDDRQSTDPVKLPGDIKFAVIVVGGEEKRTGSVYVPFTHTGSDGAHVVGLKIETRDPGESGTPSEVWVKFNPMTRTIEYTPARPEVKTLEPENAGGGGDPK